LAVRFDKRGFCGIMGWIFIYFIKEKKMMGLKGVRMMSFYQGGRIETMDIDNSRLGVPLNFIGVDGSRQSTLVFTNTTPESVLVTLPNSVIEVVTAVPIRKDGAMMLTSDEKDKHTSMWLSEGVGFVAIRSDIAMRDLPQLLTFTPIR